MTTTTGKLTRIEKLIAVCDWVDGDPELAKLVQVSELGRTVAKFHGETREKVEAQAQEKTHALSHASQTGLFGDIPTPPLDVKKSNRQMLNIGFTARVLRYLSMGNTTELALQNVLKLDDRTFKSNMRWLEVRELIEKKPSGKIGLTDKGKEEAVWFLQNPNKLTKHLPRVNGTAGAGAGDVA